MSPIVEAGECLACGHILPFAVFHGQGGGLPSIGICAASRLLAQANRGPCSEGRGCGCGRHDDSNPECMCESCRSIAAEETSDD